MKKNTLIKIIIFAAVTAVLVYIFHTSNTYICMRKMFHSTEAIKKFILSKGALAPLAFFIIQVSQVIISPIPGTFTSLAGAAVFGCLNSFLLSGPAIILGSLLAFFLARIFGRKLVIKLIGESIFNKYENIFAKNFVVTLFLLYLVPFLPDDAICFLAGLSKIPLRLYVLILIIGRLPSVIITSITGSNVLNLSLNQWIILGILSLFGVLIYLRYRKSIEAFINSKLGLE